MPSLDDPHHLQRFRDAQSGGVYERAVRELRAGRKRSHWIWFVFPQLAGLGHSPTSQYYAIDSLEQARAYLADSVLGPRLRECAKVMAQAPPESAGRILGTLDAAKLRSSMTLFLRAEPAEPVFLAVLDRQCNGQPDAATDNLLADQA